MDLLAVRVHLVPFCTLSSRLVNLGPHFEKPCLGGSKLTHTSLTLTVTLKTLEFKSLRATDAINRDFTCIKT